MSRHFRANPCTLTQYDFALCNWVGDGRRRRRKNDANQITMSMAGKDANKSTAVFTWIYIVAWWLCDVILERTKQPLSLGSWNFGHIVFFMSLSTFLMDPQTYPWVKKKCLQDRPCDKKHYIFITAIWLSSITPQKNNKKPEKQNYKETKLCYYRPL